MLDDAVSIFDSKYKKDRIAFWEPKLLDPDWAAARLFYRLIPEKEFEKYAGKEDAPVCRKLGDMFLTCRIYLDEKENSYDSYTVTKGLAAKWGVTEDRVFEMAGETSPALFPPVLTDFKSLLTERLEKELPPDAFELFHKTEWDIPMVMVATVQKGNNGVSVIMYPEFLKKAAEKAGGNIYIEPDTIAEAFLYPENLFKVSEDRLELDIGDQGLIMAGREETPAEMHLSDKLYHYDAGSGELTVAATWRNGEWRVE